MLGLNPTLSLATLLFTKHFICDFPLQVPYQWKNKGTYGHLGGLIHAFLHAIGTFICIVGFFPRDALRLALIDMVLHYHIDYVKMNANERMGWNESHHQFWVLIGLDQYLHALTYVLLMSQVMYR